MSEAYEADRKAAVRMIIDESRRKTGQPPLGVSDSVSGDSPSSEAGEISHGFVVSPIFASWNQLDRWLGRLKLRQVARVPPTEALSLNTMNLLVTHR